MRQEQRKGPRARTSPSKTYCLPRLPALCGYRGFPGLQNFAATSQGMTPGTVTSRSRMLSSVRLLDDDPRRRTAHGVGSGDLLPDAGSHLPEDERVRIAEFGHGYRGTRIGGLADLEVERHLAEKLGAEPLGLQAGAAMAEDLAAAAAMRAQKIAHVLDDAE